MPVYVATETGVIAARRLVAKLDAAVRSLDRHPHRGRVVPELRAEGLDIYRELIRHPYRNVYRIEARAVVLLAVVDGRRDLQELLLQRTLER